MIQTWDYPYRGGDTGITAMLHQNVAPEANFIAALTFKNDAGKYAKSIPAPNGLNIFFPINSNKPPIAGMLYLDWLSNLDNLQYLQLGDEGATHEVLPDGSYKITAPTPGNEYKIQNSQYNIDYTMINNGLRVRDANGKDVTAISMGNSYAEVDPRLIQIAFDASIKDGYVIRSIKLPVIEAEKNNITVDDRDNFLADAIRTSPDNFDAFYDKGYKQLLDQAGQAIIDERTQKWEAKYGSATSQD